MLYALKTPAGDIVPKTVDEAIDDVWDHAWDYGCATGAGLLAANWDVVEMEGGPKNKSKYFLRRFYGRVGPMKQYMKRKGYKVVVVTVVEKT